MRNSLTSSVLMVLAVASILLFSCKKETPKEPPSLTTSSVTNITSTTLTSGGLIQSDGGASLTALGTCWSTSHNPDATGDRTIDGLATSSFTSLIIGLTPGTTYYLRAYATNSAGTAYGNEVKTATLAVLPTLTTGAITGITSVTLSGGGEITNDGGGEVTARGVCWSTHQNPTLGDNITVDGAGKGTFTSTMTALAPGTTYYIRAYATNTIGTIYGNQVSAVTLAVLPIVTTGAITTVTPVSASCGGNVVSDGGGIVIARGVCWSKNQNPSISDAKTVDGSGIGNYPSSITALLPGTTYYVRAYATNAIGTAYGVQIATTTTAILATIATTAATSITSSTASSGGTISNDGGAPVTARGVCWSHYQFPSTSDSKTTDGPGTGIYSSSLTGLNPGTSYYIRAYATNSIGTVYGEQLTFNTSVSLASVSTSQITYYGSGSFSCVGTITSDGGGTVNFRGICWSTQQNPTTTDTKTSEGMGTGSFYNAISGLTPGVTYYFRAYATNSAGTAYGNQVVYLSPVVIPTVTTTAASTISTTTAVSGGSITSDGGAAITAKGVCWSKNSSPLVTDSKTVDGTGTGSYQSNLSGLTPATTYYYRAYATNSQGTGYGDQAQFVTAQVILLATLTTSPASSVTANGAILAGNVSSDGNAFVTERGIVYSTTASPSTSDTKVILGSGTGSFSGAVSGLALGQTYYFRAYAINSVGTAYGNQNSFTTTPILSLPTVSTSAVLSITGNGAVLGGNVTSDGNATVTERGIVYSTSANPTTSDTKVSLGTGTGSFSGTVASMASGTSYYVRAYAINSVGTSYGTAINFTTSFVVVAGSVSDIDGNSYATVSIGTQIWMTENLRVTKYSDGTAIPLITDNDSWSNALTPGYCWYNNDEATFRNPYGALYNWYAANTGRLCPTGWHLPSDAEWTILTNFLGDLTLAGGKLKESGTAHWSSPNTGATNEIGFSHLPGGYRTYNSGAAFYSLGIGGSLWSSTSNNTTQAWERAVQNFSAAILVISAEKAYGVSVRCLKN